MSLYRTKPRFVAIDILNEILGNNKSFHELKVLGVLKNLRPAEKAFVQRLVMDTLRNLDHCDKLLEKYYQYCQYQFASNPFRNILKTFGDSRSYIKKVLITKL